MTAIQMLNILKEEAKVFRNDSDYFKRNAHMHEMELDEPPTQEQIDAALTGFINHIGITRGCDYALYASDLR